MFTLFYPIRQRRKISRATRIYFLRRRSGTRSRALICASVTAMRAELREWGSYPWEQIARPGENEMMQITL